METYLVGGAVRDKLLKIPTKDKDWVVVGAHVKKMKALGYLQVGKDFPVFLHPQTKEEYALARTEKKTGPGHTAFELDISSKVSLEEDLKRRDLTINAIAEDQNGLLIDPFGGLKDIEKKVLRHVSDAFSEDPLRVLRVARFAAKLAPMGFTVSPGTMRLMRDISDSGELITLSAERVWQEFEYALATSTPEKFISTLKECGALKSILPEINALFDIPQHKQYRPEVNAGLHTLKCLRQASQLSDDVSVRYAALIQDVGKRIEDEQIPPSYLVRKSSGLQLQSEITKRLSVPKLHTNLAALVCEHHAKMHQAFKLDPAELLSLLESLDAIRRPQRFNKFLLACEADARVRTGLEDGVYPQSKFLSSILKTISEVDEKSLIERQPNKHPRELLKDFRLNLIAKSITERENT